MKNDRKSRPASRDPQESTLEDIRDSVQDFGEEGGRRPRALAARTKASASRTAEDLGDALNEAGGTARSSLEDLAEQGGRVVRDLYSRSEDMVHRAGSQMEDKVHERPLLMLLGAFVAGALLGKFIKS